jgi:diketogulonate reductase-like aldo/keto reductase
MTQALQLNNGVQMPALREVHADLGIVTQAWSPLEDAEVAAIDALDTGVRGGPDPEQLNRETHPKVVDNF